MCLQIIFNILFVLPKQPFRLSSFIYYTIDLVTDASCNCYSTFDCIWPTDLLSTRCPRTLLARNWTQLLHNLIIGQGIRPGYRGQGPRSREQGPWLQGSMQQQPSVCQAGHICWARTFSCCHNVAAKVFTLKPFHAGKLRNELAALPKGRTARLSPKSKSSKLLECRKFTLFAWLISLAVLKWIITFHNFWAINCCMVAST